MGERSENVQDADMGEVLDALRTTIHGRVGADPEQSYTARLLEAKEDVCLSKLVEEAGEVTLACKDDDHDHIRYEMGDLLYHLLVICERFGVSLEELAGELVVRVR